MRCRPRPAAAFALVAALAAAPAGAQGISDNCRDWLAMTDVVTIRTWTVPPSGMPGPGNIPFPTVFEEGGVRVTNRTVANVIIQSVSPALPNRPANTTYVGPNGTAVVPTYVRNAADTSRPTRDEALQGVTMSCFGSANIPR